MSDDDIPFNKLLDLAPGRVDDVIPGVRRVLCNNPSPFTFKGTMSYIIGKGKVAIVDPGPENDAHITALLDAVRGETVTHIFVTHTHRDHSPAVPRIMEGSGDLGFRPDQTLADGDVVFGPGWTIEAVTTPGHTANHMAFACREADVLFSGDHVMAWSTSIVAPPDGAMSDYMASLHKLARRSEPIYLPGHGPAVRDAKRFVPYYIRHREAREASILHRLAKGAADIPSLVRAIYIGIDPRLTNAAGLSVLAHLEDMVVRGLVATEGPPSIDGIYRRVDFAGA
jgi:glyoxylase-like metal-dependent hydrolase (beta-lactamase superfamily II)